MIERKGGVLLRMAKRTELICPLCGAVQLKVRTCKEVEMECRCCGASLLITKDEDGTCNVNARPNESKKSKLIP